MDKWKNVDLTEEEEVGITVEEEDVFEDEVFRRTLAGKLWSDSSYNVRAFKQTITQSWRLKNEVEIQDLRKNLYLFRFTTRRDVENVLKNGPWSFDRNLLTLKRVSGKEQPSDLDMHTVSFWTRVYDLPLKLRSVSMAKRLGDTVGVFEEMDQRERTKMGRSLRIKVSIDLRNPLKRGTMVRYQNKNLGVFFKYERLPTFCFACRRIGHQLKDCEDNAVDEEEGYEGIEEQDLPYGPWLRASPVQKLTFKPKKESGSRTCSRSLFVSTSSSKTLATVNKEGGIEVEQRPTSGPNEESRSRKGKETKTRGENVTNERIEPLVQQLENKEAPKNLGQGSSDKTTQDIERVAESLGSFDLTPKRIEGLKKKKTNKGSKQKWTRQYGRQAKLNGNQLKGEFEPGKRRLVDVIISDGTPEDIKRKERRRRKDKMDMDSKSEEVVLENQQRLQQ